MRFEDVVRHIEADDEAMMVDQNPEMYTLRCLQVHKSLLIVLQFHVSSSVETEVVRTPRSSRGRS